MPRAVGEALDPARTVRLKRGFRASLTENRILVIALAGLKELAELRHAGLDAHGWLVLAVGLAIASLSAFVATWGLLRILERFSAWPFAVYRAFIGAVLLAGVATGWLG